MAEPAESTQRAQVTLELEILVSVCSPDISFNDAQDSVTIVTYSINELLILNWNVNNVLREMLNAPTEEDAPAVKIRKVFASVVIK